MSGKRSKHLQLVLGLLVATLIASAAGSAAAMARSRNRIDEWVAERAEFVDAAVGDAVFGVIADLEGIAAYVEASDPGLQEFLDFVDQVNGTEAAVGVAYAAVVASEDIDSHVASMRESLSPSYEISRMDANGELEPIETDGRSSVYPVVRFAPGEAIKPFLQDVPIERLGIGLDGGFDPSWRSSIHDAVAAGSPFVSDFIELEFSGIPVAQVFFTSVPVLSDDGDVLGVVAAPMIEPLLLAGIDRRTLHGVEWEVMPTGSAPTRVDPVQGTLIPLELPGTTWQLAVAPDAAMRTSLEGAPWWVFGIGSGLLALLGGVTLILFVGGRSERRRADELRRVANDKDRFLATVSHELRTPLTAVAGLALELRDRPDDFGALEHRSLLSLLVEQSDELASIVEDLLIAARSDIGKVVIHRGAVDLEDEAHRAMETAGVAAEIIGSAKPAWADAQRVRQILRNLLSNAKRYGGPDVRVSFDTSAGYATVAVCDDGPPLPEAQRARIFDSYTSAHLPADAIESVGLGLFISRNLARAMGGDVEYHHDGRWSRFLLRLPLARAATGDGLDDPRAIPLGGRV